MAKDEKEHEESFRVTDRRRVHLEDLDAARAEQPPAKAAPPPEGAGEPPAEAPTAEEMASAATAAEDAARRTEHRPPPPMDFTTFILSLGSSAMVHLGDTPHPDTGRADVNLVMAKQTIDMLAMIEEKTRGNVTEDEKGYLEALLYDLRLRYVSAARAHPGKRQR